MGVGGLTRIDSPATAVAVPGGAPPGFVVVSWLGARVVPDPEIALQAVPFAAAIVGIVVAGWMGRLYSLEFLGVTGLIAVMAGERGPAQPGRLAITGCCISRRACRPSTLRRT